MSSHSSGYTEQTLGFSQLVDEEVKSASETLRAHANEMSGRVKQSEVRAAIVRRDATERLKAITEPPRLSLWQRVKAALRR